MNRKLRSCLIVLASVLIASCGGGGESDVGGSTSGDTSGGRSTRVTAVNHENSVTGQYLQVVRFYDYDTGNLYPYSNLHVNPGQGYGQVLDGRGTFNVDVDYGPYGGGPWGWFPDPPWVGPNVERGAVTFWRID